MRKIVILLLILGLAGASFFYWWNNQADIRELNEALPEGVRVEKGLFNNEYKVVNKIDGYSFKIPPEWEGVEEVVYTPERTEEGYLGTSINLEGRNGGNVILYVDRFRNDGDIDLEMWANEAFDTFGLAGNFNKDKVGTINVVTTQEDLHLAGMHIYFFENNSAVYSITNGSEEFIEYIITNGQW